MKLPPERFLQANPITRMTSDYDRSFSFRRTDSDECAFGFKIQFIYQNQFIFSKFDKGSIHRQETVNFLGWAHLSVYVISELAEAHPLHSLANVTSFHQNDVE